MFLSWCVYTVKRGRIQLINCWYMFIALQLLDLPCLQWMGIQANPQKSVSPTFSAMCSNLLRESESFMPLCRATSQGQKSLSSYGIALPVTFMYSFQRYFDSLHCVFENQKCIALLVHREKEVIDRDNYNTV